MLARPGWYPSGLNIVLVGLATLTVQVATASPDGANSVPLGTAAIALLVALVLRRGRMGSLDWSQQRYAGPLALLLFLAWPVAHGALGPVIGLGQPLESSLLGILQATAISLLATPAAGGRLDALAVMASAASVVFAATMSPTPSVRLFTLAFAGVATVWLKVRSNDADQRPLVAASRRAGWGTIAAVSLGTVCLLATLAIARPQGLAARWGWLSSSGGTDRYDPNARSGVGDGDALVRAEQDASSVAPIADTNVFLPTDTPSLYDMFNDMYGKPPKPKNKVERAVPLPPDLTPRDEQQVATSQQAGREFSAIRQSPRGRTPRDRESPALLHLAGRTPAHLRMTVFDVFDGRQWYPADQPRPSPPLTMQQRRGAPWLLVGSCWRSGEEAASERHSLKILALDSATIPLLAETTHLKIDRVEEAGYFAWQQDGVIRLEGRARIPPLTVIDLLSDGSGCAPDAGKVGARTPNVGPRRERSLPQSDDAPQLRRLAHEWTRGCRSPDEAVAAVVGHLRAGFVHDPTVVADPSTRDVVAEFLFRQKRGPDYLFATAAAMLLRYWGCDARVVSGFYASPDAFDRRSGLTPIMPEDVHFWAEWRDEVGRWRSLEPTPGYELRSPRQSWGQRLGVAANAVRRNLREYWLPWLAGLAAAVAGGLLRFRLADLLTDWIWWLGTTHRPESTVPWTLRVLDWRAAMAGRRRAPGATVHAWLRGIAPRCADCDSVRDAFLEHLALVLYAPATVATPVTAESSRGVRHLQQDCRQVLQTYRAEQMRVHETIFDRAGRAMRCLERRLRDSQ